METTIKAADVGGRWIAFREDFDFVRAEIDMSLIKDFVFDYAAPTTGSLLRTSDGVTEFGLAVGTNGYPDPAAYSAAYDVSFAAQHLKSVAGPGVNLLDPNRAGIETIPPKILREFVFRADTSRPVTNSELASLKKKPEEKSEEKSEEESGDEKKGRAGKK